MLSPRRHEGSFLVTHLLSRNEFFFGGHHHIVIIMSEETSDSSSNLNNSFDDSADNSDLTVKVICLGDSAVGKSK